jgi:hypothetical protein
MKELLESVSKLADEELNRSYEKFPKFNSPHEGYAVIIEEADEHKEDSENIAVELAKLWDVVRHNKTEMQRNHAKNLKDSAIHAAAEAIQVAAMAQKYIDSLGGDGS